MPDLHLWDHSQNVYTFVVQKREQLVALTESPHCVNLLTQYNWVDHIRRKSGQILKYQNNWLLVKESFLLLAIYSISSLLFYSVLQFLPDNFGYLSRDIIWMRRIISPTFGRGWNPMSEQVPDP